MANIAKKPPEGHSAPSATIRGFVVTGLDDNRVSVSGPVVRSELRSPDDIQRRRTKAAGFQQEIEWTDVPDR